MNGILLELLKINASLVSSDRVPDAVKDVSALQIQKILEVADVYVQLSKAQADEDKLALSGIIKV